MADNTLQYEWIVTIKGNLDALFRDRDDVFVAGDLLWYPIEGDNVTRTAPDALVAFGRPKGYRGSYMQWKEAGVAPQVVWEVLSPGNRRGKMKAKFEFYRRFGVEEYYLYDPNRVRLRGWLRREEELEEIDNITEGWRSPLTGVCMRLAEGEFLLTYPDGQPFLSFQELVDQKKEAQLQTAKEKARADKEHRAHKAAEVKAAESAARADKEAARADKERRAREASETKATEAAARRAAGSADARAWDRPGLLIAVTPG